MRQKTENKGTAMDAKMALVQFVTKRIKSSNPLGMNKKQHSDQKAPIKRIEKIMKFLENKPENECLGKLINNFISLNNFYR